MIGSSVENINKIVMKINSTSPSTKIYVQSVLPRAGVMELRLKC